MSKEKILAEQYQFDTTKCKTILDMCIKIRNCSTNPDECSIVLGLLSNEEEIFYTDACIKYYELWSECQQFMNEEFPEFMWNQIYIHLNYSAKPHKDIHVKGKVLVIAFGDYEGGELFIEGVPFNTKDKVTYFEGNKLEHWNSPITKGLKISFCCINDVRAPILNE